MKVLCLHCAIVIACQDKLKITSFVHFPFDFYCVRSTQAYHQISLNEYIDTLSCDFATIESIVYNFETYCLLEP